MHTLHERNQSQIPDSLSSGFPHYDDIEALLQILEFVVHDTTEKARHSSPQVHEIHHNFANALKIWKSLRVLWFIGTFLM